VRLQNHGRQSLFAWRCRFRNHHIATASFLASGYAPCEVEQIRRYPLLFFDGRGICVMSWKIMPNNFGFKVFVFIKSVLI
jgi:hypothetical protein